MIYAVIYANPAATMNQAKTKAKGRHTPERTNNGHSVSLMALNSEAEVSEYEGIGVQVLAYGTDQDAVWNEVLTTPQKKQKLDLAYPRPSRNYTDPQGNPQQYQDDQIPGVIYV